MQNLSISQLKYKHMISATYSLFSFFSQNYISVLSCFEEMEYHIISSYLIGDSRPAPAGNRGHQAQQKQQQFHRTSNRANKDRSTTDGTDPLWRSVRESGPQADASEMRRRGNVGAPDWSAPHWHERIVRQGSMLEKNYVRIPFFSLEKKLRSDLCTHPVDLNF